LIASRGFQALGAAMLAANSPAILTKNFPADQRGQALGLQATMTYLGLTVAPSFGGWLADAFSWHAVFFINVPVGLLALYLGWHFIPREVPTAKYDQFDWVGAFLFMSGLVALLLGLNQGHSWGWSSPLILSLLSASLVLLSVFVYWESHRSQPMLDLSLFKKWVFSASVASAVFNYVSLFSLLFLMPFYLIQGRGMGTSYAGLILTAQPVVMAIIAPISGTWSDRIGVRIPGTLGMGILALGLFLVSRFGPGSSLWFVVLGLAISGLGTGTFISPNTSAILGTAPQARQGIASGILATARSFGMVLGVGLAGAIFTTKLAGVSLEGAGDALYPAFQVSLLVASGVAVLGFMTSAVRGRIKLDR
jgi:EmrB/QacA subfamily drug resistance transporter